MNHKNKNKDRDSQSDLVRELIDILEEICGYMSVFPRKTTGAMTPDWIAGVDDPVVRGAAQMIADNTRHGVDAAALHQLSSIMENYSRAFMELNDRLFEFARDLEGDSDEHVDEDEPVGDAAT